MLKETKKIVWLGGLALLVLIVIAVFTFSPFSGKQAKINIPVAKDSNIVTDGEYLFFNSPEGDVMTMHAFDTAAEVWVKGDWKVLSASESHVVMQKADGTITVFNREEKGIEEEYDVKSDTAYCTAGAVYYKDPETDYIMQIDRKTKENVVFLNTPVNDFYIVGDILVIAQGGDKKGVALFDYSTGGANLYLPEKEVKDVCYSPNMLIYTDAKDKVRRLYLSNGDDVVIEGAKAKGLCFSKGIYFYIDKKISGYKLGMYDRDAFR